MKRLVYLLYAMGIVGCANPMPDMPPFAGEINGVRYYIDPKLKNFDVYDASEQVTLTVEALGGDIRRLEGVNIGWTTQTIDCGGVLSDGCYSHFFGGGEQILLRPFYSDCPYITPLAHEIWHLLFSPDDEPLPPAELLIQKTNKIVIVPMLQRCHLSGE